jgi:serine/threonine-protein kinase
VSHATPSSRAAADRNLLFGILALQMDFISRDDLVAAMHAWVLDKAKPLGQILVEQGALQKDSRALLDALVQKHLALHGGDAARSLAAAGTAEAVRQGLGQITDPELHATLSRVVADGRTAEDPFPTRAATVGTPTSSGLRFRILRPHAKGGLGEVSVALDEELKREVALKEIQGRYADHPESRARFVMEAEVTGQLEHPGVVPVYGLGYYADGRPYYAMRFIRGESLKGAIERLHGAAGPGRSRGDWELELRRLLRRFLDVCNAMAYAHSRGVLHRDLKPHNIMLGRYGETLVVDWGLAKVVGPAEAVAEATEPALHPSGTGDSGRTVAGTAVGTPPYMAPEQAAGRLDLLGPASDVYSLGATLYHLLSGRPPFTDPEVADVLAKVQRADFPRPRAVRPEVPVPLEAVCLKAMALRPEDRYGSVAGLTQDLERWLNDQPVSAWPEPWGVRARRWVARHRTLVTSSVAGLLVAVLSLAGVAGLLISDNQQLSRSNQAEQEARAVALQRAREAQEQRDLALRNLADAREERERAHYYLELFLNMARFGRSLEKHPLRKDFGLRVQLLNGGKGKTSRVMVATGEFDKSLPFYLSVEPERDCYVTVFYALPSKVEGLPSTENILLVFPNQVEKDQFLRGSMEHTLLNQEGVFLSPVVTTGEPAYLYILASEKRWAVKPDGKYMGFHSFSPTAAAALARQIAALVEGPRSSSADHGGIAEEIVVFNVRPDRK